MIPDEEDIAGIYQQAHALTKHEDGIHAVYRIDEQHQSTDEREIPENLWYD